MTGFFILVVATISGIFAGMGMGGGTFLIPALTIFFGFSQAICQSTNVICFIVLGFLCIYIYLRDKLIDFKVVLLISIPACILSIIFTIFSIKMDSAFLKYAFSVFIMVLGVFYLISCITKIVKNKNKYKN